MSATITPCPCCGARYSSKHDTEWIAAIHLHNERASALEQRCARLEKALQGCIRQLTSLQSAYRPSTVAFNEIGETIEDARAVLSEMKEGK